MFSIFYHVDTSWLPSMLVDTQRNHPSRIRIELATLAHVKKVSPFQNLHTPSSLRLYHQRRYCVENAWSYPPCCPSCKKPTIPPKICKSLSLNFLQEITWYVGGFACHPNATLIFLFKTGQTAKIILKHHLKMLTNESVTVLNGTQPHNTMLLNEPPQIDQQLDINIYIPHLPANRNGIWSFRILSCCRCVLMPLLPSCSSQRLRDFKS